MANYYYSYDAPAKGFIIVGDLKRGDGNGGWENVPCGELSMEISAENNQGGNVPVPEDCDEDGIIPINPPDDCMGKNCETPCPGDPVPNPEIAPQTVSGIRGGMFGLTRNNGTKKHEGLDLKNPYGAPIYAMYDGTARLVTQYNTKTGKIDGAGHYVDITSTINGKTVNILYFHMQESGRKSGTINAGDIIGYQGDSGNLKNAIKKGQTVSHLHIKIKENGNVVDPISYLKTKIDPDTGQVTTPCK